MGRHKSRVALTGLFLLLMAAVHACGSAEDSVNTNPDGKVSGSSCSADDECASGKCTAATCATASPATLSDGSACTLGSECKSGLCRSGVCRAPDSPTGGNSTTTTTGPQYAGAPKGFRPLIPGCGPETADQCTGQCEQSGGDASAQVIRPPATLCFGGEGDPTIEDPSVVIEQVVESIDGKQYVHLRITFDPSFVDNSYGTGACGGWDNHSFKDLVGSDHTELLLTDAAGDTVMEMKIDYISADGGSPCSFGTLGVSGGEGKVLQGDAAHVVAVATSLDRNLNGCGYCLTQDSPTDDMCTLNSETPEWDNRVVYEIWIDAAAFGDVGFGQAYVTYVHASPAKTSNNTIEVLPQPCPPDWDEPFCPPGAAEEGGNCFPADGGTSDCPPNYALYTASEGASTCVPIPFANYPNKSACPAGYVLDTASEGKYCLPAE